MDGRMVCTPAALCADRCGGHDAGRAGEGGARFRENNDQDDGPERFAHGTIRYAIWRRGVEGGPGGGTMLALKRLLLVIFVLTIPAALTALLYWGTGALLAATNRVIDPEIIRLAAMLEFAAFSFVAILEARDRWSA